MEWASGLGLDMDRFERDAVSEDVARRIQADRRSGILSGVNGTPTFFINNRRFDGPLTYDALQEALLAASA
jgi:protein-disulfide isomerase